MGDAPHARKFLAPYLDALTEEDHSEYITLKVHTGYSNVGNYCSSI